MNYTFHIQLLQYHLSNIEKIALYFIVAITLTLIIDKVVFVIKKQKNKKMLNHYLFIRHNKWSVLVDLLTNDNPLTSCQIHHKLEVDISGFNSKYRDILYHELIILKQHQEVNQTNWKLLVKLLYNKPENLNNF